MDGQFSVELSKDEVEIIVRALLTQDAVNGIVNDNLVALMDKFKKLLIQ